MFTNNPLSQMKTKMKKINIQLCSFYFIQCSFGNYKYKTSSVVNNKKSAIPEGILR